MATQFEGGSTGAVRKNLGLEKPAKPTGWYRYAFRFTLQASAEVELSAERVEQGGIVGLRISGMTGDAAPTCGDRPWQCAVACVQPMAGGPTSRRHTTLPPAGMR